MNIALVGCVAGKGDHSAEARDLYTSPLFKLARAYAERFDAWAILSARHGVVMPDCLIRPYDETLTRMPIAAKREWWTRTGRQLRVTWPGEQCACVHEVTPSLLDARRDCLACDGTGRDKLTMPTYTVLAGSVYTGCMTGLRYRDPMRRLGIGERLRWLKLANVLGDVDAAACCGHGASRHAGGSRCGVPGCACLHLVPELHRVRRA